MKASKLASLLDSVAGDAPIIAEPSVVVPGRTVHIDGDMLAYLAGGKEGTSVAASRAILLNKVAEFQDAAQAEHAVLQLTALGSLKGDRVLVPTSQPYQGKRQGKGRPQNWQYLRDWMLEPHTAYRVKLWDDREADDGFGYVSSSRPNDVICTNDKDMQMIPGWHLDWVTKELFFVPADCYEMFVGPDNKMFGYKWFLMQMLMGDTVDHIRGMGKFPPLTPANGCGPATAKKLLAGTTCKEEGIEVVTSIYKTVFDERWADEFAEQAVLLWIRRGRYALMHEFLVYTPLSDADRKAINRALLTISERVKNMKAEAAALCR